MRQLTAPTRLRKVRFLCPVLLKKEGVKIPSKNKDLIKKYRDAWYGKNKTKQIKRQNERRKELQILFIEYKRQLSCEYCGMTFKEHPECCDFHHVKRNKKHRNMRYYINCSKKALLEELKKCIPLCANCHRTEHIKDVFIGCI